MTHHFIIDKPVPVLYAPFFQTLLCLFEIHLISFDQLKLNNKIFG